MEPSGKPCSSHTYHEGERVGKRNLKDKRSKELRKTKSETPSSRREGILFMTCADRGKDTKFASLL